MNTIIPNELRFGYNLDDLPDRAVPVEQKSLSLSGSGCAFYSYTSPERARFSTRKIWNIGLALCPSYCRQYGVNFASRNIYPRVIQNQSNFIMCKCCS